MSEPKSESLALYDPPAPLAPTYILDSDEASGVRTATVQLGDEHYSVMVPQELDAAAILADKRRSSRASWLEDLMDGPLADEALINRTVQLVALDAYEAGFIPKAAWDEFRVATTLVHRELLRANGQRRSLGSSALSSPESD